MEGGGVKNWTRLRCQTRLRGFRMSEPTQSVPMLDFLTGFEPAFFVHLRYRFLPKLLKSVIINYFFLFHLKQLYLFVISFIKMLNGFQCTLLEGIDG